MRYYIYLDKEFLKNIYSAIDNVNFSIDVIELFEEDATRESRTINVEPGYENISDCNDIEKTKKIGNIQKSGIRAGYSYISGNDNRKSRRYINIKDVTDIKCLGFYHKLVVRLFNERIKDEKILSFSGILEDETKSLDSIIKVGDIFVFLDKEKLDIDIMVLKLSKCKLVGIGYIMNKSFEENNVLVRAISLYME